jgi:uncharacterized small protein (DUF1192 family)
VSEDLTEWIERLQAELERLKAAVRLHYDQRGDDRCHLDDLKLYHDALGIAPDPYVTALPPDEDMEESCRRYRRQRQCPTVAGTYPMPRGMTIAQLGSEVERLRAERDALTRACYYREGPDAFYACMPGDLATDYRYRSESVVIGEIRAAAGLGPIPAEARQ